jgi:VanZ family protein
MEFPALSQSSSIVERCLDLLAEPPVPLRLTAAVVAVVLTFNLFLQGAQPHAVGLIPAPWDKLAHVVFFGAIAALAWVVLGGRGRGAGYGAIAIAVGIGLADEIAQSLLPGRSAGVADLAADFVGAVLAVSVLSALRARRLPRS